MAREIIIFIFYGKTSSWTKAQQWGMTASEITSLQLKDKIIIPVLTAKETKQRPSDDPLSKYSFKTKGPVIC